MKYYAGLDIGKLHATVSKEAFRKHKFKYVLVSFYYLSKASPEQMLVTLSEARRKKTESLKAAGALSDDEKKMSKLVMLFYDDCKNAIGKAKAENVGSSFTDEEAFEVIRGCFAALNLWQDGSTQ